MFRVGRIGRIRNINGAFSLSPPIRSIHRFPVLFMLPFIRPFMLLLRLLSRLRLVSVVGWYLPRLSSRIRLLVLGLRIRPPLPECLP